MCEIKQTNFKQIKEYRKNDIDKFNKLSIKSNI